IETNIGGYHRVRWARGVLTPSPCVTDSRTLILWSQDPVPSFVRFSDIPFPYGINILVATLFIFRERATAGDSAGDYLSKSILAFVCFFYWVFIYSFMCLHFVYICVSCLFPVCISCLLSACIWTILWVSVEATYFHCLQVGWDCFYEVKGPIPRPELTHRTPRIEWIVMTPMRCQVLSSAIMRPTPNRGPNGVSLLACRCNNIGASGGLITLVAILTYLDLDYTCEWGGIYMTGTVGDYSVMMVTIVPMVP